MPKFLIKFLLEICPIMEHTKPNPILIFKRVFLFVNDNKNEKAPLVTSAPSNGQIDAESIAWLKQVANSAETDDDYDWDKTFLRAELEEDLMTRFFDSFLDRACPKLKAWSINKRRLVPKSGVDAPTNNDVDEIRNNTDSQAAKVFHVLDRASIRLTYESKSAYRNSTGLTYESKSTFKKYEREFLRSYSRFFDGRPRKLKRILNCYNVAKYIATRSGSQERNAIFMQKLFVFTVLQEMWPYRTAWLLQLAERAEEMTISNNTGTQEQLDSMLSSLRSEIQPQNEDDNKELKDIHLAEVYSRIIQGVMHSLPSSSKRTDTDANTNSFLRMLEGLFLGDLYHDDLRLFAFNLPRSVMDEVSKYENDGIISRRSLKGANGCDSWHAEYTKTATYYECKPKTNNVVEFLRFQV